MPNSFFLQVACTCEETCESVWPYNASLYASSTCVHLRLLAGPFGQGFTGWKIIAEGERLKITTIMSRKIELCFKILNTKLRGSKGNVIQHRLA